jgi:hypothetical protein
MEQKTTDSEQSSCSKAEDSTKAKNQPGKQRAAAEFKPAPAEVLFLNHISFLNQVFELESALFCFCISFILPVLRLIYKIKISYVNLVDVGSEELCRSNQHTIRKLTNKKPIKL